MTDSLCSEALARFQGLLERARATDLPEPTAVVLATADGKGRPSSRTVLLKDADERGFVFYTNLTSRKGRQLTENPRASLTFYWPPLGEQVHVEGAVTPVTEEEADSYWATRSRASRIGAWASRQSSELDNREALLAEVDRIERRFEGADVPRPPHWSGRRVVPERIEFWTNGEHRLHDRILYERVGDAWTERRLYP